MLIITVNEITYIFGCVDLISCICMWDIIRESRIVRELVDFKKI